ncbi:MAG: tyrosine-type recombinase/integrase [archaeon]
MARGNGEGTIYQRKDGRWCGQVTVGIDSKTGKPNRKTIYGAKRKEVARKMTELKQKLFRGTYSEPSGMKLADWLNSWIEGRKSTIANNTYKSYKVMINNHINPELGGVKLKDLKARQIQELLNYKLENGKIDGDGGLSTRTVRYIYQTLHASLDQAVKENMIPRNVCKAVEVPTNQEKKDLQNWDKGQVKKFLETAKDFNYYILHFLALNTGMRQTELLGLKWKDIDFNNKRLRVRRKYDRDKKFKEKLKTDSSRRIIPLTKLVIKELKRHKIKQNEYKLALGEAYQDNDLVGCKKDGKPLYYRTLYREFKKIIEVAGLPEITFHDTRHTFATLFLEAGGDIAVLKELLGHSTINMTIDIYGHVSENMLNSATKIMENMYISL